jgi:hypothetical protein
VARDYEHFERAMDPEPGTDEYPRPRHRLTLGDGFRLGLGFTAGVVAFWLIVALALVVLGVLIGRL